MSTFGEAFKFCYLVVAIVLAGSEGLIRELYFVDMTVLNFKIKICPPREILLHRVKMNVIIFSSSCSFEPVPSVLCLIKHSHDAGTQKEAKEASNVAYEVHEVKHKDLLCMVNTPRGKVQSNQVVVCCFRCNGFIGDLLYKLVCIVGLGKKYFIKNLVTK